VARDRQTDRHRHADGLDQYTFRLAMPNAKCNDTDISKLLVTPFAKNIEIFMESISMCDE